MDAMTHAPLSFSDRELAIIVQVLEGERDRLLVEIRRTEHRAFRNELRDRLTAVEHLLETCRLS